MSMDRAPRCSAAEVAELIGLAWPLGRPTDDQRLPLTGHVLDEALKMLVRDEVLPAWAAARLHFVPSISGDTTCVELPEMINWLVAATFAGFGPAPFDHLEMNLKPPTAAMLLKEMGLSHEAGCALGHSLKRAVRDAERGLRAAGDDAAAQPPAP